MGVDTKAIIRKGTTIIEIKECLEKHYSDVTIHQTSSEDFFSINFKLSLKNNIKELRNLSCFFGNYGKSDYGIDGVLLSVGCWGNAEQIMHVLLDEFGGYLDFNDCDGVGFEPYNHKEFNKGKDFSKHDLLVQNIIFRLGHDNLPAALELFEEFKSLSN